MRSAAGGPAVTASDRPVPPLAGAQRPLERGGVGGRQPGGARVGADVGVERVDLGSQVDPLEAGGDHVRRKTTPYPPSGYVQRMAPSVLQTR